MGLKRQFEVLEGSKGFRKEAERSGKQPDLQEDRTRSEGQLKAQKGLPNIQWVSRKFSRAGGRLEVQQGFTWFNSVVRDAGGITARLSPKPQYSIHRPKVFLFVTFLSLV